MQVLCRKSQERGNTASAQLFGKSELQSNNWQAPEAMGSLGVVKGKKEHFRQGDQREQILYQMDRCAQQRSHSQAGESRGKGAMQGATELGT